MPANDTSFLPEFERLRRDFEVQASQYHDLTLSVYYETPEGPIDLPTFRASNHRILLWQYIGKATPDSDVRHLFSEGEVSAFGVIMGPSTELFVRMARRAGSLFPSEVCHVITSAVGGKFADPEQPGKPVFTSNSNPLAVWLDLILVFTAGFQPERFRSHTLAVDPFAASLLVFDYFRRFLASQNPYRTSDSSPLAEKRFKVALSFPGERRPFVGKVAACLQQQLGDIFYDLYYEAELARPNLDTLLQRIYHDNSELIVVFLCAEYGSKEWTGLEWRALRDLIKKRQDGSIMLVRFDGVDIPGVFSIDGYIDVRQRTPDEIAAIICKRYRDEELKNRSAAPSHGPEADT